MRQLFCILTDTESDLSAEFAIKGDQDMEQDMEGKFASILIGPKLCQVEAHVGIDLLQALADTAISAAIFELDCEERSGPQWWLIVSRGPNGSIGAKFIEEEIVKADDLFVVKWVDQEVGSDRESEREWILTPEVIAGFKYGAYLYISGSHLLLRGYKYTSIDQLVEGELLAVFGSSVDQKKWFDFLLTYNAIEPIMAEVEGLVVAIYEACQDLRASIC